MSNPEDVARHIMTHPARNQKAQFEFWTKGKNQKFKSAVRAESRRILQAKREA